MSSPVVALARLLERPAVEHAFRPLGDLLFGSLPARRVLDGPLVPRERHTVSVIMPSHGYAAFIEDAIDSAATQEGVDVEVLVVDDCGPDDSLARAHAAAARHPGGVVRVVENPENLGHTRTFVRGCELATGEFFCRLDADDLLVPGALRRAVAVMEQVPSVGLVYGRPLVFTTPVPPRAQIVGPERATVWSGQDWLRRSLEQGRNLITTPEAVVRRSLLDEVGPWRVELKHSQDLEFWLRAASAADVAHVDGVFQAAKREHPQSMSNTAGMVGMMLYTAHRDAVDALAIDARVPDAAGLRAAARRAVADDAVDHLLHMYARGRPDPELAVPLEGFARDLGAGAGRLRLLDRAKRLGPRAGHDPRLVARAGVGVVREKARLAHWRVTGL